MKRHVYNTQRDPSLYVHRRIGMGSYTTSTTSTTNEYKPTSTNQQVTNQQVTNQQVNKPTCYKPTCYKLTGQCGSATDVAQHEFGSFGSFGGFGPGNQSHRKKVSIDHTRHCMYTYK